MDSIPYTEPTPLPPIYRHGNSDILPARAQREAAAAEQPWTATRCHRQLRPLLAHLTAFRREKTAAELKKKNDDSRYLCNTKKRLPCDSDAAERKRVRYTYSLKGTGRRRRKKQSGTVPLSLDTPDRSAAAKEPTYIPAKQQSTRSFSPGEIVLATPMISRARKSQQAQCLPSSPLACMAEAASTAEEPSKSKFGKSMSGYGYYRRLPRLGSNASIKTPVDEEWVILSKETPTEYHGLYEAVFRTVGSILRATMDAQDTKGKPKSLLAMCLRKVPQFISMWEDAEHERSGEKEAGTSNVSMDIYNDLESMGRAGSGWKHLRAVVREHALNMLREACAEGLFHFAFIRLLVRLCINTKAYVEAEAFMDVLFDVHVMDTPASQRLFQQPSDINSCIPEAIGASSSLDLLLRYSHETGRTSSPLRLITSLLRQGHLPCAWLSTPTFTNVWHRVARLLSSRGPTACDAAGLCEFLVSAMAALAKSRPDDDAQQQSLHASPRGGDGAPRLSSSSSYHALVSILGTMCAISILQREALSEGHGAEAVREPAMAKRLANIIHCCLAELGSRPCCKKGRPRVDSEAFLRPRRYLLELALCVLGLGVCHDGGDAEPEDKQRFLAFVQADGAVKGQLYDVAVAFATSVAENCGRGSRSATWSAPDAREYLDNICQHLSKRLGGVVQCESGEKLSRRLLADAAFLLASRSNNLRDLAFAESLGKSMKRTMGASCLLTPGARATPTSVSFQSAETPLSRAQTGAATLPGLFEGYRWEEGISEWVISTPISAVSNAVSTSTTSPRDGETGAVAAMKPDLLRTPTPYLTPSPSMRESTIGARSMFDDISEEGEESGHAKDDGISESDESDADGDDAAPSPELPARRVVVGRPARTTCASLPSSDFSPYSSDSDWMGGTRRRPGTARSRRASLAVGRERPRPQARPLPRPRQSLSILDLVSDDIVDDEFDRFCADKSVKSAKSVARVPLLSLVGNARRSIGAGQLGSKDTTQPALVAASSDDELGL